MSSIFLAVAGTIMEWFRRPRRNHSDLGPMTRVGARWEARVTVGTSTPVAPLLPDGPGGPDVDARTLAVNLLAGYVGLVPALESHALAAYDRVRWETGVTWCDEEREEGLCGRVGAFLDVMDLRSVHVLSSSGRRLSLPIVDFAPWDDLHPYRATLDERFAVTAFEREPCSWCDVRQTRGAA